MLGRLEWEHGWLHDHIKSRRINGSACLVEEEVQHLRSVQLVVARRGCSGLVWLQNRMDMGDQPEEEGWSGT